ncbi:hypothetical protein AY551_08950 [Corynebacterium diphtheriae bv. gravis]|uniref:hypothetical protein n=1 Tax=Corynebacterium diphtheriae TaxID=1717 RepID=UPI0005C61AC3|nr:hypothetical protein [Corynebacterium diphtheriae]OWN39912.1 hypothetical protein AY510_07220 [Corynebacterium diphtheriae bv. gravis]KJJ59258.1 hypothetical protein NG01_08405 [Corynebacterium diphtheriae]OSQ27384.1 hypothetical protein B9J72_04105 [Corynebacterium diphtheriae]OWN67774.1 hypothetical protein AY518_04415 [Corynebacterium diphtheriae bv. gravis]OWO21728.1 hypothetical protein AY535_02820 [Corynebacterium diphtheriae bv. gravis]
MNLQLVELFDAFPYLLTLYLKRRKVGAAPRPVTTQCAPQRGKSRKHDLQNYDRSPFLTELFACHRAISRDQRVLAHTIILYQRLSPTFT